MHSDYAIDAPRRLGQALTSLNWLESLAEHERPGSIHEAYRRQVLIEDALGFDPKGWKIAGASARGMRASPLGKPLFGRLWRQRCHATGAELPLPLSGAVTIEMEVAVRFARQAARSRKHSTSRWWMAPSWRSKW